MRKQAARGKAGRDSVMVAFRDDSGMVAFRDDSGMAAFVCGRLEARAGGLTAVPDVVRQ